MFGHSDGNHELLQEQFKLGYQNYILPETFIVTVTLSKHVCGPLVVALIDCTPPLLVKSGSINYSVTTASVSFVLYDTLPICFSEFKKQCSLKLKHFTVVGNRQSYFCLTASYEIFSV